MNKCCKCGSEDILTRYIEPDECVDTSSLEKVKNEFIYSIEYSYFYKLKANIEHLFKTCCNCQYKWRENVLQGKESDNE